MPSRDQRRVRVILAYRDLEFCWESIDDEEGRRARDIVPLQHFQPSCNR